MENLWEDYGDGEPDNQGDGDREDNDDSGRENDDVIIEGGDGEEEHEEEEVEEENKYDKVETEGNFDGQDEIEEQSSSKTQKNKAAWEGTKTHTESTNFAQSVTVLVSNP